MRDRKKPYLSLSLSYWLHSGSSTLSQITTTSCDCVGQEINSRALLGFKEPRFDHLTHSASWVMDFEPFVLSDWNEAAKTPLNSVTLAACRRENMTQHEDARPHSNVASSMAQ